MDKQIFLNLTVEKQIDFYNDELKKHKSFTGISKEIGISKSISEKFKKHGYRLIDGIFQLENKSKHEVKETTTSEQKNRTIVMDNNLWKQLKIYSVVHDTTISKILEQLARDFLKNNQ